MQNRIYEGDSIIYQITIVTEQRLNNGATPDLSDFKDFQVESPKVEQSSSFRQSFLNGQHSTQQRYETLYSYRLIPLRSGDLVIPPPKVMIDEVPLTAAVVVVARERYRTPPHLPKGAVEVRVNPPDQQDDVILSIETDKERYYPLQHLTVSLVVRIKKIPDRDPLSPRLPPPELVVPWVEDPLLPKGLLPKQNNDDWLTSYVVQRRTRGFSINGYGLSQSILVFSSPFGSDFDQKHLYEFLPPAKTVQKQDQTGATSSYWEYRFDRVFVPQEFGRLSFGPAKLRGSFDVADSDSPNGIAAKRYYALAKPIEVEIVDVPQANRPPGYSGALGSFDWSADIQPRTAKVGDPLTLTLTLSGTGSTSNVTPPDIASLPEVAGLFKVSPVNDKGDTYIYTIRPTQDGTVTFPAIRMSYFDVEKERFVTLESKPISLDVAAAQTLPMPFSPTLPGRFTATNLERAEGGLFANMTDWRGAIDQSVPFRLWTRMLTLLCIGYGMMAGVVWYYRHKKSDPARERQQSAFGKAKRELAKLKAISSRTEKCNAMQGVLTGYVADLTNSIQEGMTVKDVCEKLERHGTKPSCVDETRAILETLDGAKYGGIDSASIDALPQRIEMLIDVL